MLFTDDSRQARLNAEYRGKNKTTDVLSFAADDPFHPQLLGDVIISVEQARRQCADAGAAALEQELVRLLVHGLCHLLGHDHHRAGERARMRRAENELLAPFGLASLIG